MRRLVIIATRETEEAQNDEKTTIGALKAFFAEAGWEVHFAMNKPSIFSAYSDTIKSLGVNAHDQVILCHDDIQILMLPSLFNSVLSSHLKNSKTGFVGVAGSAALDTNVNWFACAQQHKSGGGMVYHGDSLEEMQPTCYGAAKLAVVLDGVFLATTGKVLNTIHLDMPSNFVSGWDVYDTYYTFQTHLKKLYNVIVCIPLRHASGGRYSDEYHKDNRSFAQMFVNHLPAVIN